MSPACASSFRWNDSVGAGNPSFSAMAPGLIPERPAVTRRRKTARRVSCASAASALTASFESRVAMTCLLLIARLRFFAGMVSDCLGGQVGRRVERTVFLHTFAVSVHEIAGTTAKQQREFDEFLHDIDQTVVVRGRLHPAILFELFERLGNRALVGDGEHPHPSSELTKLVHRVERLGAAAD